jgi:NhaA family Na+:H+ antiporter
LFLDFFKNEKAGGVILVGCTIFSIFVANSSLGDSYLHFWHRHLNLSFAGAGLDFSIQEWINSGLMSVFFLMVGLEMERELYAGKLSDLRNALLPVTAALGGMIVPALIHYSFNHGRTTQAGFGIPMATDIAFSLGILSLLGSRVPSGLKIFLTALAIIDDLGAVILIAILYTQTIVLTHLLVSLGIGLLLFLFNKLRINRLWVYLLPALLMWYFMLKSGVHPTVSGVILAFLVPFSKQNGSGPSERLQYALHRPVNYLIVPLFALANTGIQAGVDWHLQFAQPNSIGILLGLFIGKPLGILVFTRIAVGLKWCRLPEGINWKFLSGAGVLAGIGFTMSIFITNLAFEGNQELIDSSKISIFIASLVAASIGLVVLSLVTGRKQREIYTSISKPDV